MPKPFKIVGPQSYEEIKALGQAEKVEWKRQRLLAMQMGLSGRYSRAEVSEITGLSIRSIGRHAAAFRSGGVKKLLERDYGGGPPPALNARARRRSIWFFLSTVGIFLVTYCIREGGGSSRSALVSVTNIARTPETNIARNSEKGNNSETARELTSAVARKDAISEEEKSAIQSAAQKLESSLQAIGAANSTVVYDRKWPHNHTVALRVMPPSKDEMEQIYVEISSQINSMRPSSAAESQMRETLLNLVFNYSKYPMAVKMLNVIIDKEENRVIEVAEYFVDDESLFIFKPNGDVEFPPGDKSIARRDTEFGTPRSWAMKRYSHLIQIHE